MKTIRLACCGCDSDDMDGIDRRELAQAIVESTLASLKQLQNVAG